MTSPCYRCHERRLRCHAECEAYAEWKKGHGREPSGGVSDDGSAREENKKRPPAYGEKPRGREGESYGRMRL